MEAAEASSRSAERETPLSAFLFANFFFAPSSCKEKVAEESVQSNELSLPNRSLLPTVGAKVANGKIVCRVV